MRSTPKAWPEKNTAWRIWIEQGVSSNPCKSTIPIFRQTPRVMEIHRLWRVMPEDLRAVMLVFYVRKASPKDKAKLLEIDQRRLYERRANMHYYIAGRMDEKNCAILPPESDVVAL